MNSNPPHIPSLFPATVGGSVVATHLAKKQLRLTTNMPQQPPPPPPPPPPPHSSLSLLQPKLDNFEENMTQLNYLLVKSFQISFYFKN